MAGRVDGKIAVITGGARGMGAEHARLLAEEGARVIVTDVLAELAAEVAREICAAGNSAIGMRLDVSEWDDWLAVLARARSEWGDPNILVNNASVADRAGLADTPVEDWHRVVAVNQTGTFFGIKALVPAMRSAGGGSIVNISSVNGILGLEFASVYQATKGAVRMMTKTAAVQHAAENIRVNSVHPGLVETPMTADLFAAPEDDPILTHWRERTLMPRFGTPRDIAQAVLFLASDEASWVTGAEFVIDGGYSAH
jgi:NAD(P)-dependent dehydrogenase (short-subunit alcohol dehydrogenase family)